MIKELKNFLERVSYIRKFTPRLALVTSGLSKLLKKGNVFIWGAEQPNVFHRVICLPYEYQSMEKSLLLYLRS